MKSLYTTIIFAITIAATSEMVNAQGNRVICPRVGDKVELLPYVAIKTNLISDATTTLNLALEVGLGKKTTIDLSAYYNPFVFNNGSKFKLWAVQPELRYYLKSRFNGHFFGIHPMYGQFNVSKIPFLGTENLTKQGDFYGAGISYGYQWKLGKNWNMEASLGVGFARLKYDIYDCENCGRKIGSEYKTYFGPTKIALSIIYIIR